MSHKRFRGIGTVVAVLLAALVSAPPVASADASLRGGDYVPFPAPTEVLDTREGTGGVKGVRGPASVTAFQVLGVGRVPATGVGAVLVRLVSLAPSATTWMTAYPDGETRPGVSMLNVGATENLSNTAIVRLGANGRMAVYNHAGNTNIVVEVQGYFTTGTGSTWGGMVPVTQTRVIDTRSGVGTPTGTIPAGGSRTVNLATGGVPAGASAVFASLIVPNPSAAGWFTAAPAGGPASPNGIVNYENGTNSTSAAAIPLATDGRVTFVNRGSAAAHLVIDTMAYFTRTATAGAGYRPATKRLAVSTVAANSTGDVMVGGTNGMPTRGVAGAALSLGIHGTAAGYLRAWPLGATEPVTVVGHHPANIHSRSSAIIKPGTDGKVRIRNISGAAITLYTDLEGWFAEPLPAVPVAQYSPMSVLQSSSGGTGFGRVQYAYVDNLGRVVSGLQTDVDNTGSVQWTVISGNEAFSGRPALSQQPDGGVQLAALYTGSHVWATSQTAPGAATWKPWTDAGGAMSAPPVSAALSTGTIVIFAVDVDGKLWAYAQTGAVPFWHNLGDRNLVGSPTAALVRDGVQLFARDDTGAVHTVLYRTDGSVGAWSTIGGTGTTDPPTVVVYPGYRLRVFVRAADGTILTKQQDPTGTFPSTWDTVGTFVSAGAPAAILDPALGRTAVVARGQDDAIYRAWETAQGSGVFGTWAPAIDITDPSATDPTVAPLTNSNGQTWLIAFRNINGGHRIYERGPISGLATPAFTPP